MDIPMLDEYEWSLIDPFLSKSLVEIMEHRRAYNVSLEEALECGFGSSALALYFELTGFKETNINAIYHHRISLYGPPCVACGKPLRTPRARFCAACGAEEQEQLD